MRFIHKLSDIGHPVDGALVGAGSLWPSSQRAGLWGFSVYKRRLSFLHCCAFFPFDQFYRVFDGSIVMVLATKGICRRCFVVFKIGGAFGSCYASIRALEVSSFALTTEFVFSVCVFFLLLHSLRDLELQVFWVSIQ